MIRFASVFSDYAVLQRGMPLPVWGYADPRMVVEVRFRGECRRVLSTPDGRFLVRFRPGGAGGPFVLEAGLPGTGERCMLREIMVGEVWLASGQSNMEMSLNAVGNGAAEEAGMCESVRMLNVPHCSRTGGRTEFRAGWALPGRGNAGSFSAAAFYFAREVAEKLGVTVGILHSSWGGTDAMAWCSREALVRNPDFRDMVLELEAEMFQPERWSEACDHDVYSVQYQELEEIVRAAGCPENDGVGMGWAEPGFDDSGWKRMTLPARWNREGENYNGVLWFRREVEIPAEWAGRPLTLSIGAVDKHDITYFNGVQVGATGSGVDTNVWSEQREYRVPAELVRSGRAVIAVRAYSFLFDGGLIGPAGAMRLYPENADADAGIVLCGAWRYATEFNMGLITLPPPPPASEKENLFGSWNMPYVLYENMIAPLIPYAMRGVIWYQGEHNTLRRNRAYGGLMRSLIEDWRRAWGQGEFPFYQVQLPGFHAGAAYEEDSTWAPLRIGQQFAAEATGNDFAVTLDLGDAEDIHPKRKREVGERLARLALHHEYGVNLVENGPMPFSALFEGDAVRLRFRRCAEGLRFEPGPTLFAIAGEDGKFLPVEAEVIGGGLRLPYAGPGRPRRLRYAWADNPQGALLRNGAGLPAPTFELAIL